MGLVLAGGLLLGFKGFVFSGKKLPLWRQARTGCLMETRGADTASKAIFMGTLPLLFATMLTGDGAIIARAILIGVFLLLTTPVSAHIIGRAAFCTKEAMKTPDLIDESGHLHVEP